MAFFKSKLVRTVLLAIFSAAIGYVAKIVFGVWGVLDGISNALGQWLKVHVTAEQAGWTLALVIALILFAFAMWRTWHITIRHIHHKDLPASTAPIATETRQFIPKSENERRRALLTAARDLAHQFNQNYRSEKFSTWVQTRREFFDIEPFLSHIYRNAADRESGRAVVLTDGGHSNACDAFVRDIGRLQQEWGLTP